MLDLNWVQSVIPRDRDSVFGFVRESQNSLFADKNNNSYFNIPSLISYVILYHYKAEHFTIYGDDIELNEKDEIVSHIGQDNNNTVYGNILINFHQQLIYEWIIKVIKLPKLKFRTYIGGIGLDSSNKKYPSCCYFDAPSFGNAQHGFIYWNNGQLEGVQHNSTKQFREGDAVKLRVNTKSKQCDLFVNDTHAAKFAINDEYNYYFAMTLCEKKCSFKLTHFEAKS